MSKKKFSSSGIVYSTDPNFSLSFENEEAPSALLPKDQKLRVRMETKHRAGKVVTLIEGYVGTQSDKEEVIKKIKSFCGTGGSAKDGELLVQGDQREKVYQWLIKNGFLHTKKI